MSCMHLTVISVLSNGRRKSVTTKHDNIIRENVCTITVSYKLSQCKINNIFTLSLLFDMINSVTVP